jgi:phage FluMu protein Com
VRNSTVLYDCKKCNSPQELLTQAQSGMINTECTECKTINGVWVEWFKPPTKNKLIKFKKKNDTG